MVSNDACCKSSAAPAKHTPHPLDPLSAQEVEAATTVVRKHFTEKTDVKAVKVRASLPCSTTALYT